MYFDKGNRSGTVYFTSMVGLPPSARVSQTNKQIQLSQIPSHSFTMVSQFVTLLQLSAGKFQLPKQINNEFSGRGRGVVLILTSSFHSSVVITANRNVKKITLKEQDFIYFNCFQISYHRR